MPSPGVSLEAASPAASVIVLAAERDPHLQKTDGLHSRVECPGGDADVLVLADAYPPESSFDALKHAFEERGHRALPSCTSPRHIL